MDKLTDVFCHFDEDVGKHVEKAPKTGAQKNYFTSNDPHHGIYTFS